MKKVLVLCTSNSCRSQMAEGYLRFFAPVPIEVTSAGLEKDQLHPIAVEVMNEDNIDISSGYSKAVVDLPPFEFDYLITVCDDMADKIPSSLSAIQSIHIPHIPDPAKVKGTLEEKLEAFRHTRELIKKSMLQFIGRELMTYETPDFLP